MYQKAEFLAGCIANTRGNILCVMVVENMKMCPKRRNVKKQLRRSGSKILKLRFQVAGNPSGKKSGSLHFKVFLVLKIAQLELRA